ncbi:MAG: hypothetical protein K6B67_04975 [Lachnospiraceae bacterium]|nr:hypothetical protein [Lachnospiraceae bacterium]
MLRNNIIKRAIAFLFALILVFTFVPFYVVDANNTNFFITFTGTNENRVVNYTVKQDGEVVDGATQLAVSKEVAVDEDKDVEVYVFASTNESDFETTCPDGWNESEQGYTKVIAASDIVNGLTINATDFFKAKAYKVKLETNIDSGRVSFNGTQVNLTNKKGEIVPSDSNNVLVFKPGIGHYVSGISYRVEGQAETNVEFSDVTLLNDGSIQIDITDIVTNMKAVDAINPGLIKCTYSDVGAIEANVESSPNWNHGNAYIKLNNKYYTSGDLNLTGLYCNGQGKEYYTFDNLTLSKESRTWVYQLNLSAADYDETISRFYLNWANDSNGPTVKVDGQNVSTTYTQYIKGDAVDKAIAFSVEDDHVNVESVVWSDTSVGDIDNVDWTTNKIVADSQGKYILPVDFDGDADEATYYIYTRDTLGNKNSVSIIAKKDADAPVVTSSWDKADDTISGKIRSIFSHKNTDVVNVTFTAQDDESGTSKIVVMDKNNKVIGQKDVNSQNDNIITIENVPMDAVTDYKVKVYDKVGNFDEYGYKATLDRKPCSIKVDVVAGTTMKLHKESDDIYFVKTNGETLDGIINVNVADELTAVKTFNVKNESGDIIKSFVYDSLDKKLTAKFENIVLSELTDADNNGIYEAIIETEDQVGNDDIKVISLITDDAEPEILNYSKSKPQTYDGGMRGNGTFVVKVLDEWIADKASAGDKQRDKASSIKEVIYKFVGEDLSGDSVSGTVVDNSFPNTTFQGLAVPTDFKGYVEISAVDNVGNTTTSYTEGIINTNKNNGNATINIEDAAVWDDKGNPLYNHAVNVGLNATDNFAYISKITCSINASDAPEANVIDAVVFEADNSITSNKKITVPVDIDSNDITITFKVYDTCGNAKEYTKTISIDKTAPVIEMSYDNNDADSGNKFKANRIGTIKIVDRNFNPDNFKIDVTASNGASPSLSNWDTYINEEDPKQNTYISRISFVEDGDYEVSMSFVDKANNSANIIGKQQFSIDKTAPIVEVAFDNNDMLNDSYYAAGRTATITVREHYFDPNRIVVNGLATIDGRNIAFPGMSGWTNDGDVHTAKITFSSDGDYEFTINAADQSGNVSPQFVVGKFTIDQTIPVITFGGVEENSANKDAVEPTVTFEDINYDPDNVNITLTGANSGHVNFANGASDANNGQTFVFSDFAYEKEVDDIYTLTATITDKAGNQYEDSFSFSVNRFGSNYILDDTVKGINGKYIKEPVDVVLTETNVNSLTNGNSRLVVSTNGNAETLSNGADYQVAQSGGSGTWSRYVYTIDKSVFAGDGTYIVSVYSEDEAGNVNENNAEGKDAEIKFGVDSTKPEVVLTNLENDGNYNETSYDVIANVSDNLVLENVKVSVDGKDVDVKQSGDNYGFTIPESSSKRTIVVTAEDAAGNRTEQEISGVLVSTNAFVRFMGNTPAVVAAVAGVITVAAGGIFVAANGGVAGAKAAISTGIKIKFKKK